MGVFTMPSLGADMESGRIVEWLVQPGDVVHRGDVVAVVDTTKAAIEVEVFEDGTVGELLVQPGAEVDVGTPLAVIVAETDVAAESVESTQDPEAPESGVEADAGRDSPPSEDRPLSHVQQAERAQQSRQSSKSEQGEWTAPIVPMESPACRRISLMVMPPVRHLARQMGVNLESLSGSGPNGRITRTDVVSAVSASHDSESRADRDGAHHPEPGSDSARSEPPTAAPTPELHGQREREGEPSRLPQPSATDSQRRLRATPRARRLAARHGLDLALIVGTGANGAITGPNVAEAVTRSLAKAARASQGEGSAPKSGRHKATGSSRISAGRIATGEQRKAMRRSAIAALMARSAREIPHYYVSQTVDLTQTLDWLRSHNADLPVRKRVLPAALFLRATVQAAQEVGEINGHWVHDAFVPAEGVQLGVAVSMRDGGLLTPVIIDAHLLDLDELMSYLGDLVRRARAGRLRSREIEPGSITVSSLADGGPDALFGVIYPPQVALVGIGGVAERPWAVDGALAARSTVTLTIAADHRATDGRIGAKFLAAVGRTLTTPEEM